MRLRTSLVLLIVCLAGCADSASKPPGSPPPPTAPKPVGKGKAPPTMS